MLASIITPAILLAAAASAAPFYTITDLGDLPGGGNFSIANGVNDSGQVVGFSFAATGSRAFLWQNGVMTNLGDLPGGVDSSEAAGINNNGQVVGTGNAAAGRRAFLWQGGVMTDLGTPSGFFTSAATDVSDSGQVVGSGFTATGDRGFLLQGGVMTNLGDLPDGGNFSRAFGVNDNGQVVGVSGAATGDRAFLWDGGVMTDLGDLPGGGDSSSGGGDSSLATGINNGGQVVGRSGNGNGTRAFMWEAGSGMVGLNSLLVNPTGWILVNAEDINTSGQIVGYGAHNGALRGFLLDPVEEPAEGEPIAYAAELFQASNSPFLQVFNDRAGVGRTFRLVTGDRIREAAYVFPSPDSDVIPFACGAGGALQCVTSNGALTDVDVLIHGLDLPTTFVGLTSGLGGFQNQYTRSDLRSSLTPEQLNALDANPVQFQISGDGTPAGPATILRTGPDYNPDAMPGFVNNITISGGGLSPIINWQITDDPLAPANSQSVDIRRVSGNVADGTFESFLVHSQLLAAGATSYTFGSTPFSVLPGETGLMEGATYEVEVRRNIVTTAALAANLSRLQGTSRTFFEFTPLADDIGGIQVYLPSVDADGNYHFDFAVTENTPVVIDPLIAIGYDYQIGAAGDPLFASVLLPTLTLDDGLYDIYLWDGDSFDIFLDDALAGVEYFFGGEGVDRFRVLGIDLAAMLDPTDVTAFLTTLTFASSGQFTGTMTPVTFDTDAAPPPPPGPVGVPEPGAITLLGAGLFGLVWARRRRQV